MPPTLPTSGRWPQRVPSRQQDYFTLSRRNPDANDQFDVSGPFLCAHTPANGQLVVPGQNAGTQVLVDERVWMPAYCGVGVRSIITNVQTGKSSIIVFVKPAADFIECYASYQDPT